jgi:hypothetical protein
VALTQKSKLRILLLNSNSIGRIGVLTFLTKFKVDIEERANHMKTKRIPNQAELVPQDSRWTLLVNRDRHADGTFFYSVVSTGVCCRPSCGARTHQPENVKCSAWYPESRRVGGDTRR